MKKPKPVKSFNGISVALLRGSLRKYYMKDWTEEQIKEYEDWASKNTQAFYYFFRNMKKDDKFVLTPEIYSEVLEYYGYKVENGKFIKKPKIPEFEYFGKWKNRGFRP